MLDGAGGELGSPIRYFVALKMYSGYAAQSAGTGQSQPVNDVGQIYSVYPGDGELLEAV